MLHYARAFKVKVITTVIIMFLNINHDKTLSSFLLIMIFMFVMDVFSPYFDFLGLPIAMFIEADQYGRNFLKQYKIIN